MKRYEYTQETMGAYELSDGGAITRRMNRMGEAGWNVFHVHEMVSSGGLVLVLYASREIESDG